MRVAIVHKLSSAGIASEVKEFLKENEIESDMFRYPSTLLEKFDAIITVGGDGTVLKSIHHLRFPPPVFSINTGRIGILTHASPENYRERLLKALRGDTDVEEVTRVSGRTENNEVYALNEIAVLSASPARLIELEIHVDGIFLDSVRADGVIISTPTGSTAYALSAGGAVVDPDLQAIALIPVSPFRVGSKPWIFSPERAIEVRIKGDRAAVAVADGITSIRLNPNCSMTFMKADFPARFYRFESRIVRIINKIRNLK